MLLSPVDERWMKGKYINFFDDGPLTKNAMTHKYVLLSKHNGATLGFVKWNTHWRKYCLFVTEALFDETCLAEIIEFLKLKNEEHKKGK